VPLPLRLLPAPSRTHTANNPRQRRHGHFGDSPRPRRAEEGSEPGPLRRDPHVPGYHAACDSHAERLAARRPGARISSLWAAGSCHIRLTKRARRSRWCRLIDSSLDPAEFVRLGIAPSPFYSIGSPATAIVPSRITKRASAFPRRTTPRRPADSGAFTLTRNGPGGRRTYCRTNRDRHGRALMISLHCRRRSNLRPVRRRRS
jgi:hypothetical protein